ncbi:hypothetical protein [Streptomyces sp. NRRL S-337]|uniref:hypothetical protein n=1 Tax=Streptomyces sp. NRRL S-337 TaxID=1463900 RepID=UPI001F29233C|nr:hypothetical protein [Streptomyces sp. NRRL S-337]
MGVVLHEIGMVSEERWRRGLEEAADWAHDEVHQYQAARALVHFGVAVSVHADDIDSIYDDYEALLEEASEVADNSVTISHVRLIEGEEELEDGRFDTLEFERDGEVVTIEAEHFAEDYYDHEAACNAIAYTAHDDDTREWHSVGFDRDTYRVYDTIMLLATPEQRKALTDRLGFRF